MYIYLYVSIYIYIYLYTYIFCFNFTEVYDVHTYVCLYVYIYIYIYIYMYIYIYVFIFFLIILYLYIFIYVCIFIYTSIYIYVYIQRSFVCCALAYCGSWQVQGELGPIGVVSPLISKGLPASFLLDNQILQSYLACMLPLLERSIYNLNRCPLVSEDLVGSFQSR